MQTGIPGPRASAAGLAAAVAAWAVLAVLAGSPCALAQGVSLSRAGSGARAAGMADAFVAVSDDGTAASWNPAGLGQLRQPEFSFVYAVSLRGLDLARLRSPDERLGYSVTDPLDSASSSVDFASAAVPFSIARKPITLQASWRRLYQLDNTFGGKVTRYDLTANPFQPISAAFLEDRLDGSIDLITLAGAIKITSRLALGGSVDWWRGDWENRVTAVEDIASPPSTEMFSLRAPAHLRGTNASAGLLLTYPSWNVGLVYHAPFWSSVRFANTVRSTVTPPLDNAFDARFQFPRSIAGGVAWRPAARWTAALAVTHDQWTEALVEAPGLPGPINFFDNLPPEVSTTRDTVSLNFGVEHLFVHDGLIVPLRLGAGWEPQGEMDEVTRDPVDYLLFSAGTGYNTNRFKLDLAVQWRRAGFRSGHVFTVATAAAQNIYGESLARDALGDAVSHEWRIKVSAIYRLQDTTKLKGIFKKIFG